MNLLEKNNVSLKPVEFKDLEQFKLWRNDKDNIKYFREYRLLNSHNQEIWFERIMKDDKQVNFSIIFEDNLSGHCGLYYIDWRNRNAEFGIYVGDKKLHGNGIGTTALLLLLTYGFNVLNLHKIWCEVYDNNSALSLYENIGFKKEGVKRDNYYWDGKYHNSHILSMLSDEFYSKYDENTESDINANPLKE